MQLYNVLEFRDDRLIRTKFTHSKSKKKEQMTDIIGNISYFDTDEFNTRLLK